MRRLLIPAVLAYPLWSITLILILRPSPPELSDMDLYGWAVGTLFNVVGILLVCLPVARSIGRWAVGVVTKLLAFVTIGAVGGFAMLALLGLAASMLNRYDPFDLRSALFGLLGLWPGAITAAVWFATNRDIFVRAKETQIA